MGAALAGCGMGRGFCWNGWDETCGSFVEEDEALLSPSVLGLFSQSQLSVQTLLQENTAHTNRNG